VKHSQKWMANL